jgi:hypothetical protein
MTSWLMSTRMMRAPEDGNGAAAQPPAGGNGPAAGADASGSSAAPAAAAEAPAAPVTAPSALSGADSGKRDGAKPNESSAGDGGKETPPPGGPDGKPDADGKTPDAKDAKPDAAAEAGKTPDKDKPADGKPDGAEPAADKKDAAAESQPPAPPVYDAYKLPENFKVDEAKLSDFNTILGKAELAGKADHATMQALGQELVNFYAQEVDRIGREVMKYQVDVWNRHCEQEFNVLKNDPAIGGNRIDTTLGNAKYVLEQFGGSKDEQSRLMASLDRSGISHNRDFVALLHRMYERYREPEPVQPNLPSMPARQPGQRNWYETVDGGGKA